MNEYQCDSPAVPKVVAVVWQVSVGALANDKGKYNPLIIVVTMMWLHKHLRVMVLTGSEGYLAIEVIMAKYGLVEAMTKWFILLCVITDDVKGFPPAPLCVSLRVIWGFPSCENMINTAGCGLDPYFLFWWFFFLILIFIFFWWLDTIHFGMLSYRWKHEGTEWIRPCRVPWAWATGQDTTDVGDDVTMDKWLTCYDSTVTMYCTRDSLCYCAAWVTGQTPM